MELFEMRTAAADKVWAGRSYPGPCDNGACEPVYFVLGVKYDLEDMREDAWRVIDGSVSRSANHAREKFDRTRPADPYNEYAAAALVVVHSVNNYLDGARVYTTFTVLDVWGCGLYRDTDRGRTVGGANNIDRALVSWIHDNHPGAADYLKACYELSHPRPAARTGARDGLDPATARIIDAVRAHRDTPEPPVTLPEGATDAPQETV